VLTQPRRARHAGEAVSQAKRRDARILFSKTPAASAAGESVSKRAAATTVRAPSPVEQANAGRASVGVCDDLAWKTCIPAWRRVVWEGYLASMLRLEAQPHCSLRL
jgi:hypothetical protein